MEPFEIMEFCNECWNYIALLFGIPTLIISNIDEKIVFHLISIILPLFKNKMEFLGFFFQLLCQFRSGMILLR